MGIDAQLAPLRALNDALTPAEALRLVPAFCRELARGCPFRAAGLGPPSMPRDRASRAQARPAVQLYRALRRVLGSGPRALEVTAVAVEAGAVAFLADTLGDLDLARFAEAAPSARRAVAEAMVGRFFTTTATVDEASADRVRFTVTACRLVSLVTAAGHPELGPTFCRGDATYFASLDPPVALTRQTTLATGGTSCPFVLTPAELADAT